MKKLFTILILLGVAQLTVQAANWGLFGADRSRVSINFKGTTTEHFLYNSGYVGFFHGTNLGVISAYSDVFKITKWQIKTWKSTGGDVTGANLYYRIYEGETPSGSFTQVAGTWIENLVPVTDQRWGDDVVGVDGQAIDISGLQAGKTYKLAIYIQVTGTGDPNGSIFDEIGVDNHYTATFTTDAGLPVELTAFGASLMNSVVNLKWETATEVNNYGFEVERKTANTDWSKIGFVEGHNSTNSPKYYSYSDKPVGTGKIAYRLKQIDNDGQFEYSPVVEVLVDNLPNGFVLEQNYPNPFNPETSIRFALKEDTKATLKVYNSLGAEIATLFDGTAEAGRYYDVKFGGSELASGFYIYKLVAGEYVSVKKMLLMK